MLPPNRRLRRGSRSGTRRKGLQIERLEGRLLLSRDVDRKLFGREAFPTDLEVIPIYRINAGGPALEGWSADNSASPAPYSNASAARSVPLATSEFIDTRHPSLPPGTPEEIFSTERLDRPAGQEMSWEFKVKKGLHEVRLYFAENSEGVTGPDQRTFDVRIEGKLALDDYDVYARAGGFSGVVESFLVNSDNKLNIDFLREKGDPSVQAIEVLEVQGARNKRQLLITGTSMNGETLDFGTIVAGEQAPRTITLTNLDPKKSIKINQIKIDGPNRNLFRHALGPKGKLTLEPGESTTIDVTALPTGKGRLTADLTISAANETQTISLAAVAESSSFGFGKSLLANFNSTWSNPTSLQIGPDNRLYVAHQRGEITVHSVVRRGPNDYAVTNEEVIDLVKSIPNHNDDGVLNPLVTGRLVTGILVVGTPTRPVLYVTSSDPRIGGGTTGKDLNLDTNSGILSRLDWTGLSWVKTDLVVGLPRSEENHASNGMTLDASTNTLFIAQGGHTNQGAPSNNLAFLPEYALSAAILSVDLDAIGNTTYILPTLMDETRPDVGSLPQDTNDPFGGNDGLNQAIIVPGGPVQVYSPGYRNPYDVVFTRAGRLYTIDNGSNSGWGGVPLDANGNPTTPATAGQATNAVHEAGATTNDNLHLVTQGFYGGHPAPTRANMVNRFGILEPQSPVPVANPVEGYFRAISREDMSLATWTRSTNGLTEYTGTNFGGVMDGNLLAVSHGNNVYRIELNATGTAVVSMTTLFSSVNKVPLDVTVAGPNTPFPGTIWVADYMNAIVVFEPNDFGGSNGGGTGEDDETLDEDGDGYNNHDEIQNGTDPLSAGDVPPDYDVDFTSNLLDPDDDNDAFTDLNDPFAIDPLNGRGTNLPVDYTWENEGPQPGKLLGLGFTGLMTNGTSNYETLYDPNLLTAGGAAGVLTIDAAPSGTAYGAANTQTFAFQFGIDVNAQSSPFVARTRILSPFAGITPEAGQRMGFYFGNGDQDNYVALMLDGDSSVKLIREVGGTVNVSASAPINHAGLLALDLSLTVNPLGTIEARFTPSYGSSQSTTASETTVGAAITIPPGWFTAVTAPAVGVIATTSGSPAQVPVTWDFLKVEPVPPDSSQSQQVLYRVNAGGASLTGTPAWTVDTSASPSPYSNFAAAGSQTFTTTNVIDLTHASIPTGTPMSVFQSERYDGSSGAEMAWSFPVAQGRHEVRLYFAETFSGAQAPGKRRFDVSIEGTKVLDDYDVFADVGGYRGVVKSFVVDSDATLNVDFARAVQNPSIKAIEILRLSGNAAPIVNAGPDQSVGLPGPASLAGVATDDGLPANGTLTTTWSVVSGPGVVTFADPSERATTATFSAMGSYVLRLTASDGQLSTSDELTVVVGAQAVVSFSLINAETDTVIPGYEAIADGSIINLATLPTRQLNIRANTSPAVVGSVLLRMDGGAYTIVENVAPYAVFKDDNGNFRPASLSVGLRSLSGTPYSGTGAGGTMGTALTITFHVVDEPVQANQAPDVDAGPDQSVTLPGSASLSGVVSDDGLPLTGTLTTTWTKVSGPGVVTFADPTAPSTTATFSLAGTYVLRLSASDGQLSSADELTVVVAAATTNQTPFGGTPWAPPVTIEAENFDLGGAGVAFHDTTASNLGGAYRTEGVDIQNTSGTGGRHVSHIQATEWLEYTVNVPTTGDYTIEFRVASSGLGGTFHAEFGGVNTTGSVAVPNTGGWQTFQTVSRVIRLQSGQQVMRLAFDTNGPTGYVGNLDSIRITAVPTQAVESWTTGASMPVALGEVAGGIINGKMYMIGEGNSGTYAYDIATNTWSGPLATRPYAGHHHAAEVINNRLYLFGGLPNNSGGKVQIYNPETNTWTFGASMPFATSSAASALIGGKVYVAGGIIGATASTTDQAAVYDPATDTWTSLPAMPQGVNHAAASTDGRRLFIFGGRTGGNFVSNGFDTVQIYDTLTGTWTSSIDQGSTLAPLPQARGGMGKAVYHKGEFYVMGGETSTGPGATADKVYNRVDIYNPVTNTWRLGLAMPTARHGIFPLLHGGKIYVAGGGPKAANAQSTILEIYDPGT